MNTALKHKHEQSDCVTAHRRRNTRRSIRISDIPNYGKRRVYSWPRHPQKRFEKDEEDWGSKPTYVFKIAYLKDFAIEKQFNELASKWKKQTSHFSTMFHIVTNSNYMKIIAKGYQVVPLILKDLQKGPEHWHEALRLITDNNPVSKEDMTDIKKIREAWLQWGKERKMI